jgi:hypothetical protein
MVIDDEGAIEYHFTRRHNCYVPTKNMREWYLLQKPWVCQVLFPFSKLNNPKLHGSVIKTMTTA